MIAVRAAADTLGQLDYRKTEGLKCYATIDDRKRFADKLSIESHFKIVQFSFCPFQYS